MEKLEIRQGDILMVKLKGEGSLQNGIRPCLVVSNNRANAKSPIITVIPFTSRRKKLLPVHVDVTASSINGLKTDSTLLVEQKTPINKEDVIRKIGYIEKEYQCSIGYAILINEPIIMETLHLVGTENFSPSRKQPYRVA